MTKFTQYLILTVSLGLASATPGVQAQTCRVNIGSNRQGCSNYIEVYEYDYVTEKPMFPGGDTQLMRFINREREYPREAYERGIQGRVTCSFVW